MHTMHTMQGLYYKQYLRKIVPKYRNTNFNRDARRFPNRRESTAQIEVSDLQVICLDYLQEMQLHFYSPYTSVISSFKENKI